jgi:hypothetical protein
VNNASLDSARLARLRVLVGRLERLPASPRKEWMLEEARARMVDVETGYPSITMRPLDGDRRSATPPPRRREPAAPRSPTVPERRVTADRRTPAPPRLPAPPERPVAPATDSSPAALEVDARDEALPTEDLLWLDYSPAVPFIRASSASGSQPLPPWRRGLRG